MQHSANFSGRLFLLGALYLALSGLSCETTSERASATQKPANPALAVQLEEVLAGLRQPTDIQFVSLAADEYMVVLQQAGEARWRRVQDGQSGTLFKTEVVSGGELGLLGLAFHPKFSENGLFYINRTVAGGTAALSRIDEWRLPNADFAGSPAVFVRNIMEVDQPFRNHNAGQLQFGPDGFMYIGWGDGGSGGDPDGNAQNPAVPLGKMLRIDVDRRAGGKPYAIPADNPFVGNAGVLPEIWALGLRNPWRYSFDPGGRLIVADVGQNRFEEISIVEAGKNYGWDVLEGTSCFEPPINCSPEKYASPFFEYSHRDGYSITGGYVYTGKVIPTLAGKYVFGDLNGMIWAIDLPAQPSSSVAVAEVLAESSIMPTTFGRDRAGEVYVAGYTDGVIYKLVQGE